MVGNPYLFIGPKKVATLSVTALVAALRRVGRNQTAHEFVGDVRYNRTGRGAQGRRRADARALTCGDQASAAGIGPRPSR